jgi:hypothetical protein
VSPGQGPGPIHLCPPSPCAQRRFWHKVEIKECVLAGETRRKLVTHLRCTSSRVWLCAIVIPALWRLWEEDYHFDHHFANLSSISETVFQKKKKLKERTLS